MITKDAAPCSEIASETTQLLNHSVNTSSARIGDEDKPLPLGQLACVCYARMLEPIAYFSIFPFIGQMVVDVGRIKEADIGFYSGLIESLFSITQMAAMIFWGRASDRYGRRPILLLSLVGETVSIALFGFSSQIWHMILLRCVAGMFSGTLVTLRTITSEISTPATAARAYSWFMLAGNMGVLIGPALGGVLARPADLYPRAFGGVQFFHDKPYALVTICIGTFAASVLFVSAIFIRETSSQTSMGTKAGQEVKKSMSVWQIITSPGMSKILLIHALTMMVCFAYNAVVPVFWYLSPSLGGYGFSPAAISVGLIAIGILQTFTSLLLFPLLQRRFGSARTLQIAAGVFPIFYALTPVTSLALRGNYLNSFWALVSPIQVMYSLATMAPVSIQLLLNAASPTMSPPSPQDNPLSSLSLPSNTTKQNNKSTTTLGTTNSIALAIQSGVRIISPITFSSLFAISVKRGLLHGYLIWLILTIMSLACFVGSFGLSDAKEEEKSRESVGGDVESR